MNKLLLAAILVIALTASGAAFAAPRTQAKLHFINHLQAKMPEQDVYIERVAGSGEVFRVTANDKDMNAPLYAAAEPVKHDPKAVGPYRKGRALGIGVGQWLAATGTGTNECAGGQGSVTTAFRKLVPNGLYTMWYAFLVRALPPERGFTGVLPLPLGKRDGSQNTFRADAAGNARYGLTLTPCLQLSGVQLASGLAIAWHSDGKTYAADSGPPGTVSHVQLFVLLPSEDEVMR